MLGPDGYTGDAHDKDAAGYVALKSTMRGVDALRSATCDYAGYKNTICGFAHMKSAAHGDYTLRGATRDYAGYAQDKNANYGYA
jgi:hypothetical protein